MKWTTLAIIFILAGILMIAGAFISGGFDITKLGSDEYVTNTYVLEEDFANIRIITDTADINFEFSDDGESKVVCYDQKKVTHFAEITDGDLIIGVNDSRKWYDHLNFAVESQIVTVYLPAGEYSNLTINSDTGDVTVPDGFGFDRVEISGDTGNVRLGKISASGINISTYTGDTSLTGITCKGDVRIDNHTGNIKIKDSVCNTLSTDGYTGDLVLKNVIASDKFSFETNTGNVNFKKCDATTVSIETSTGDINGTFLSDKIFLIDSKRSKIDVPQSYAGGKCKIETDTGEVKIRIAE